MARILLSRLLLSAFVVLVFTAAVAVAQTSINDQQGFKPFDSLSGGDVDSVSLTSGGLVLHIPLASFPQRGNLDLSFHVYYNRAPWHVQRYVNSRTGAISYAWSYGGAWLATHAASSMDWFTQRSGTVDTNLYYHVISPDGASHPVSFDDTSLAPQFPTRTLDATGVLFSPFLVLLGNGTRINTSNYPTSSSMTDRNGNQITLSTNGWTDTLGRSIPGYKKGSLIVPGAATSDLSTCPSGTASAEVWNVPGLAGGTRTFKFCYANVSIWTNFQVAGVSDYPPTNTLLMNAIVLPNLTTWTFSYDNYGNVIRLGLPSGGAISYSYQVSSSSPCAPSGSYGSALIRVSSRSVDANDGTGAHTWTYTYGTGTTTVTSPDGNDAVHTVVNPINANAPCYLYETQAQYFQGTGASRTLLKTVATQYTGNSPLYSDPGLLANVVPTQITTTWANGQSRKTVNTYDPGVTTPSGDLAVFGSLLQRDEYDFSGSIARSTINHYLWQDNSTYLSNNFLSLLASVTIKDGGGTQVAKSTYGYDEVAVSPSGISTPSLVAPPAGGNIRGNQTTASRWLNTTNSMISSTAAFFDTGMKASGTDPLGHTTTYAYSSTYLGAYRTQTCNPQTNGINHCVSASYDYNTGLETQFSDENNLVSTYQYDNMMHLAQANRPDGGQTTISFNDAGPSPSITTTKKMNSTQSVTTFSAMDGLRRVKQLQFTSDPQGTVYTDTTYDSVGRVYTVSNPYRSGSDPTTSSGTTTYAYDGLGRKTSETYSDGSLLTTAYCGPNTLVTDPTGRWRRSRTDALGRLVEVDEPNAVGATVANSGCPGSGEPIWVTTYGYDTLGNLTGVLQNGSRQRTFTYDSLSRLLTSNNPETGTITYKYDSDTNCPTPNSFPTLLVSKTDARGMRTCAQYDALNRQVVRNYSNGDPTVTTAYDQSNCLGLSACQNIGQRTGMTDAAGSESWAYQVDATNSRSIHRDQRTTTGIAKTSTYYLDLAGNLTSITYPTGRVVNYTYNSASRAITAVDGSNGITYATDFQSAPTGCLSGAVCYTPQGTFYALSIGQSASFTGLNLTHSYNSRLQPNEFKASSTGGNAIDITYNFLDPSTNKNAGHVYGITNNLDTTRSQTFAYDQLNRISSALTTSAYSTSPTHCWGETYTLDAWGNLNSIARTTNSAYTGCSQESGFSTTADGNNHLPSWAYDASGNATSDGVVTNYQWDAESQLKSAAGVTYTYDGDGRRVAKVGSKLYWYGSGGDILAETDASGNTTAEYIFFGGKRVAMLPAGGNPIYYVEDLLGTSRVITTNAGVVCYDADFYPYGGERSYTNTCPQNYKFEAKERDTETGNDDFGARYYSNRFGRWLSADWSGVPVPVPYANLTNPQTLNLYSMVADNPESFADLDGHILGTPDTYGGDRVTALQRVADEMEADYWAKVEADNAAAEAAQQAAAQAAQQAQTDHGRLDVQLQPNNATRPGEIDIQSGAIINGTLTTSQKMTPGEATVTVNLYDNKDTGNHAPPGTFDIRVGQVEQVTVKVGDQTQTSTRVPIQIMMANKDQNFGFHGGGTLHFTVTDSKNNAFKGDHKADVSQPHQKGGGHADTLIKDAGRKTFNVPN